MKHLLLAFSLSVIFLPALAQKGSWRKETYAFQEELNRQYRDPKDSPLDSIDQVHFKEHDFFPVSKKFCVKATFVRTADAEPFRIETVSGVERMYKCYGALHFVLNGQPDTLYAYEDLRFVDNPDLKDFLFIPFRDHSSGEESYGGGRYIDWKKPEKDKVRLNFNLCYNPYCAYSTGWNCPIPPEENYIDQKVLAGVKNWKGGH